MAQTSFADDHHEKRDEHKPPLGERLRTEGRKLATMAWWRKAFPHLVAVLSFLAAVAAVWSVWFAAEQVRYAADTLQLQQTFAIIDDQRQFAARLLSGEDTAAIIKSDGGTPDKRRKVLDLLGEYDATLLKFSMLVDKGVVAPNFKAVFIHDFCRLYKWPFIRGWWEESKRAEPYASLTDSYKRLDEACLPR